jgi:hypothetical protein
VFSGAGFVPPGDIIAGGTAMAAPTTPTTPTPTAEMTEDQLLTALQGDGKTAPSGPHAFQLLVALLDKQKTNAEMRAVAIGPVFQKSVSTLTSVDVKQLQEIYAKRRDQLRGKLKMEQLDGVSVSVDDVDFWHSEQFGNDGVTIKGKLPDGQRFQAMTGSAPVVRFYQKHWKPGVLLSVLHTKAEHPNEEQRAKGFTLWKVKNLPIGVTSQFVDIPFGPGSTPGK